MIVGEGVAAVAVAESVAVGDAVAARAGATVGDVVGAGASAEASTRGDEVMAADPSSAGPWLWPAYSWPRLCSTEATHAGAGFVPSALR